DERLKAGGLCPPGYENWWLDWEAHSWPAPPPMLRSLVVSVMPRKLQIGQKVTFTVTAKDGFDGTSITDAAVPVNGKRIGTTGQSISFAFHLSHPTHVDPETHQHEEAELPTCEVIKSGYYYELVPIEFVR